MEPKIEIIRSHNFISIQKFCEHNQLNSLCSCLIGGTGQGKSTGLFYFKNNVDNVFYLCKRKSHTPKIFFGDLLKSLGEKSPSMDISIYYNLQEIARRLNGTGKKNLVIIDEASKLSVTALLYIHELINDTNHTTGFVLSSTESLIKNLKKWQKSQIAGVEEFERRITEYKFIDGPTKAEIRSTIEINDIHDEEFIFKCQENCERFSDIEKEIIIYKRDNSDDDNKSISQTG